MNSSYMTNFFRNLVIRNFFRFYIMYIIRNMDDEVKIEFIDLKKWYIYLSISESLSKNELFFIHNINIFFSNSKIEYIFKIDDFSYLYL